MPRRKTFTKADIVAAIQARMGFPRRAVTQVVDDLLDLIQESLAAGEPVNISGFGRFEVKEKSARPGRNPRTGEEIPIPPRRTVTFKPGQPLRRVLRSPEEPKKNDSDE